MCHLSLFTDKVKFIYNIKRQYMTATINGIPVYNATIPDEDCGMMKISLVDDPAVMSNFLAFDNTKKIMMYSVESDEKRLVLGVVMRADFPIYRCDSKNGEFYIMYKAETIREMAEKYLLENRQNNVNLMHEDGTDVDGVDMVQYFIKDSAKGISPSGFDEITDGSLFAEFHVTNDDVWDAIKDGTYKGFSLEGVFAMSPETDTEKVDNIVDSLDGKFNRTFNKLSKKISMTKLSRFKANLLKLLAEFANVTTDKGILAWDGDDDLKEGDSVYIEDADGNKTKAEDGDYKTDDNKVIVVVDGKVSEIKDADAQVAPTNEDFAEVKTDNGTLIYEGEGELVEGTEVFVETDGERTPAPDGDYKTEDGKVIKVADGKVSEIVDDNAEVAPTEETKMSRIKRIATAFSESYDEKMEKIWNAIKSYNIFAFAYGYIYEAADDYAILCYYGENTDWEDKFVRFDVAWDANGNAVVSNPVEVKRTFTPIDAPTENPLAEEVETLKKQNAEYKKEIAKLQKLSGAKPAHEEVKTSAQTPLKGGDRIAYLMSLK